MSFTCSIIGIESIGVSKVSTLTRLRTGTGLAAGQFRPLFPSASFHFFSTHTYFHFHVIMTSMLASRSRTRSLSPFSKRVQYSRFPQPEPRSRSPPRENSLSSTPPRKRERSRDYRRRDSHSPSPPRRHDERSRSPRRRYSRSPTPPRRERQRSRSPRRRHDDRERPRKSGGGGFKWKEKPSQDHDVRREDGRLERGYQNRDTGRLRARSPTREEKRGDDIGEKFGSSEQKSRKDDIDAKFGGPIPKRSDEVEKQEGEKPKKEKKEKKPPSTAPTGEPMIIVNVNDRLGTKAAIPCLASDPISMSYFQRSEVVM